MVDGGVAPIAAKVERHEGDIKDLKGDVGQLKISATRTETMTEMLLRERGIRPPPKLLPDGGQ